MFPSSNDAEKIVESGAAVCMMTPSCDSRCSRVKKGFQTTFQAPVANTGEHVPVT
jgi:hypothetical protein